MKIIDAVLDLLYPPRCAFCHRLLRDSSRKVCKDCEKALPYTGHMAERAKLTNIERCVAPFFYEKTVRESLHRFKFGQLTGYAGIYAGFMVKCIDENAISCDSITWAPVSRRRLRRRGYDQAQLLAEELAQRLGLPCIRMLRKTRDTKPQSRLKSEAQRRENAKDAYACLCPEQVRGRRVLLVDDIVTSGATLSECARVLKQAGAAELSAVTAARKRD